MMKNTVHGFRKGINQNSCRIYYRPIDMRASAARLYLLAQQVTHVISILLRKIDI